MKLTVEQELTLLLADFRNPNKERIKELLAMKLDWTEVLGHLIYNRVAGVAYDVMQMSLPDRVNREFRFGLYMSNDFQKLRTRAHRKLLHDIASKLNSMEIPYAILKGSILASSTYPDGGRMSDDIDLLVSPENVTKTGKVLEELGFVQGMYDFENNVMKPASRKEILYNRLNTGEVYPYRKYIDKPGVLIGVIDLNFSLDWKANGSERAVTEFLVNTEMYEIDGASVRSLSREYFLVHLCLHLYKEATVIEWVNRQRDLSLYKFLDIYAFVTNEKMPIDWDKFFDICKVYGTERECYYALKHTQTFFPGIGTLHMILDKLQPDDIDYLDEVLVPIDDTKYKWNDELLIRFFNTKRYESIEQNEQRMG